MEIDIEEKIIGTANVDRSWQVFTLFERLPVQKDTQFKTLNSEIVYPVKDSDPESHTLFCGTYPYRSNKGVPPQEKNPMPNFRAIKISRIHSMI